MDANRYATKKTIAQGMLDIALLTANASQLKYILQVGQKHEFYTLMLIMISVSIIMQVNFSRTEDSTRAMATINSFRLQFANRFLYIDCVSSHLIFVLNHFCFKDVCVSPIQFHIFFTSVRKRNKI